MTSYYRLGGSFPRDKCKGIPYHTIPYLAVIAATAGYIERAGDEVADLHILHLTADLDYLARDLVAQHHARLGCRAPAYLGTV